MGCSKRNSSERGAYSNTILLQQTRETLNGQPNSTPKVAGNGRTTNPQSQKEINHEIRAEITEKEMKETITKI